MKDDASRSATPASTRRRSVLKGFAGAAALAGVGGNVLAQAAAKEAPALAKLVGEKKLPPLAQRLPSAPLVKTGPRTALPAASSTSPPTPTTR